MRLYRHILLAYDFSAHASVVLENGKALAERFGAKLTVLHVRDTTVPVPDPSGERLETTGEVDDSYESRLAVACAKALAGLDAVHTEVVDASDIAETLCAYAKKGDVDLIVAGNQGVSGIVRMLMGSVAEEIVRHAPCAVLIVRAKTG